MSADCGSVDLRNYPVAKQDTPHQHNRPLTARCKTTARPELAPAVLNVPPYASAPRRNLGAARYVFHRTVITSYEPSRRACRTSEIGAGRPAASAGHRAE